MKEQLSQNGFVIVDGVERPGFHSRASYDGYLMRMGILEDDGLTVAQRAALIDSSVPENHELRAEVITPEPKEYPLRIRGNQEPGIGLPKPYATD